MPANGPLTQKEKELVAVGASIAAGCQPCTTYHFRAACAAGAGEEEIRQAVSDALDVRRSATEIMARLAEHLGGAPRREAAPCPEEVAHRRARLDQRSISRKLCRQSGGTPGRRPAARRD